MASEIRVAREDDAEAITELLIELGWFEAFTVAQRPQRLAEVRGIIRACLADDSHTLLVAGDEASGVIAYASIHWLPYMFLGGGEGYLSELFVSKGHRGEGMGSRLLARIVEEARLRGCSRLALVTSRHRESYRRDFYKHHGWRERDDMAHLVLEL